MTDPVIRSIKAWTCSFDLPWPLILAGDFRLTRREYSIARVETADGIVGSAYALGRGTAAPALITDWFEPILIGADPNDVETVTSRLARQMAVIGAGDVVARAISLIDICLWDIKAQLAAVPLHKLLGIQHREQSSVLRNVTPMGPHESLDDFALRLQQLVTEGYIAFKTAVIGNPALMLDYLRLFREVIGPSALLVVDAHWAWLNLEEAVQVAKRWQPFDLAWIEDPFPMHYPQHRLLSELRDKAGVRVAFGDECYSEPVMRELLQRRDLDVMRVCVSSIGGISRTNSIVAEAAACGVPVSPHVHPEISQHLVFAWNHVGPVEMYPVGGTGDCADQFIDDATKLRPYNGWLNAPIAPGLGMTIDWQVVTAHARAGPSSIM